MHVLSDLTASAVFSVAGMRPHYHRHHVKRIHGQSAISQRIPDYANGFYRGFILREARAVIAWPIPLKYLFQRGVQPFAVARDIQEVLHGYRVV
jgi:hypothetical protein